MTNPNPAYARHDVGLSSDPVDDPNFDAKGWIMQRIYPDDPVELRRNDLRGWAEAAHFENVDVRNLGEPDFWEMRFNRGTNAHCATAAEAEYWLGCIVRECECQFVPGQFVAIVQGDQIAARFRLQPGPQPEQAG